MTRAGLARWQRLFQTVTEPAIPIHAAWKFCPRCGVPSAGPQASPFACSACGYRHYFSPCTAVGALITDCDGRLLWIVRGKDPGQGLLALPGGFVDAGETAETALVREIREEVNLDVEKVQFLASFPNQYAFSGVVIPVTDLFFVASVRTQTNIVVQQGEVDAVKWTSPAEVDPTTLAFSTHQLALQHYIKHQTESGTPEELPKHS